MRLYPALLLAKLFNLRGIYGLFLILSRVGHTVHQWLRGYVGIDDAAVLEGVYLHSCSILLRPSAGVNLAVDCV